MLSIKISVILSIVYSQQKMILQDLSEEKRINAKNSVEEFVYELRGLLSEEFKNFTDNQVCMKLTCKFYR